MKFSKTADISAFDTFDFDLAPGITIVEDVDLDFSIDIDTSTLDFSGLEGLAFNTTAPTFVGASASASGLGFSSVSVSAFSAVGNDGRAFTSLEVSTFGNADVSANVFAFGDNISFDFF